jgi:excisionase family DNA binding protein
MKFPSGISVLLYWYNYGEAVREYVIPAVFISEDDEGKAPFIAPESFDYPDWWYTWIDCDLIIRKLSRQDWALILYYFENIHQATTGTFYRWDAKERFKDMCGRIYSMLDDVDYKPKNKGYRRFDRVLARIKKRIKKGEIEVSKIEPHKVYTPTEVADILRYHVETIYTMLQTGKIKGVKPGTGEWRIPGQAILDLLGMGEDKNE